MATRERLGNEAAISVEVDELFVKWMDWMDSSGRALVVMKAGIMKRMIARYAALVEYGNPAKNTLPRPLFGRSADLAFDDGAWLDDIHELFDANLPDTPGEDALYGFMLPILGRIVDRMEANVKTLDTDFEPNHKWWIEEKGHDRVWTGYLGADRAKRKIKTPHARDAFERKIMKIRGGFAKVKHKDVVKQIKPRKRRSKPPAPKAPRVRVRESRAKDKPLRIKIPGVPKLNMDSQRMMALKKGQSKRATKTRFKPKGAKGTRYRYNRPFPR